MRDTFHRDLEALDQDVVRMGALVEEAVDRVTTALVEGDRELAARVKQGDDPIDELYVDIEKRALLMLAQQAPVARDLRLIVAILRVVTDLERAGDLAYNIAKVVEEQDFRMPRLKPVRTLVSQLGRASQQLLGRAIDTWATKDLALAAEIRLEDDQVDELHARLFEELAALKGEQTFLQAVRLALVNRYFERIGDHAVNMADRVRYYVTGDEELLG